ncbi:MAG: hypothetical protein J6V66_02030 [Clostridia bacterium]|nr:hypothetical protein [Clostridia bacterium]
MAGTFWAFVPAIVAIVLALLTKQVYVSLFIGILVGALMFVGGNPLEALGVTYTAMSEKLGENAPILVFLVILGIFVILMQKSGGSKAYGEWAQKKISSKKGALGATAALGCLIFVDDYFNCLTVGSVMRPVTDKFKVSHSKLAWIIDSTAAPVCIIAPISSWAAAVSGELEGNGIVVFMKTIPFNLYALLTIIMVFAFCYLKLDFGKMKKNEAIAETSGDLNAGETDLPTEEDNTIASNPRGKVRHLIIPVVILIVCCIGGMIYSGFFYNWGSTLELAFENAQVLSSEVVDGGVQVLLNNNAEVISVLTKAEISSSLVADEVFYTITDANTITLFIPNFEVAISETSIFAEFEAAGYGATLQSNGVIEAFSNCDAGTSLAIGSTLALIIVGAYYMIDKVVSFKAITESFTQGFKTMVPAILILTFAWTISGIMGAKGGYLDAQAFVDANMNKVPDSVQALFPAIFFICACAISFATGTSWGTFGVLVPIAVAILGGDGTLVLLTVSATLGGAVFGDHVSPISDTTILASTGGNCNHIDHVKTQLPYAALIAGISFVTYVVAGYLAVLGSVLTAVLMWVLALALLAFAIFVIKLIEKNKATKTVEE